MKETSTATRTTDEEEQANAVEEEEEPAATRDSNGGHGSFPNDSSNGASSEVQKRNGKGGEQDYATTAAGGATAGGSDGAKRGAVVDVIAQWASEASMHGVPNALDRENYKRWKRCLWAVITISMLSVLTWQLTELAKEYKEYGVTTDSEIIYPTTMAFPEVTVCNTNMYSTEYMEQEGITEPVNDEEVNKISQRLEDFINDTSFNGIGFNNVKDAWLPVITTFGRCWRFRTDERVAKPGLNSGLFFVADIHQQFYTPDTRLAGLAVFVASPGSNSSVNDQVTFTLVSPGVNSIIKLGVAEFDRVTEEPWSRCRGDDNAYTQPLCRSECLNKRIREACGCRDLGDHSAAAQELLICTTNSNTTTSCDNGDAGAGLQFLDEEAELAKCNCVLPPCTETIYEAASSSLALSEVFLDQLANEKNISDAYVRENLLYVSINFDAIRYQMQTESKTMSFSQLLSSAGGSCGLFAGMSFISIIELFGDLMLLRLVPRFFGRRQLYGIGSKEH
jgi:hypothetical protein